MGLQALIFDVDGTLAETAEIHRSAFNQAFEEFNIGWHWDRQAYSYLMHMPNDAEMLRAHNAMSMTHHAQGRVDAEILQQITRRKMQVYLAMLAGGAAYLRPGVGRLIDEAKREGIALAIASCRSRLEFEMLVTNTLGFDALSLFDAVRTAEDCEKPCKSPYGDILYDLGVKASQCVAIDDAESGIREAAICGINTIATPGLYTSSGRFDAACIVVSDLGRPSQPFNVIFGDADGKGYISAHYLHKLVGDSKVAA